MPRSDVLRGTGNQSDSRGAARSCLRCDANHSYRRSRGGVRRADALATATSSWCSRARFDWPNTFRTARFIPAVDYVNANRVRSNAIQRVGRADAEGGCDRHAHRRGESLSQLVATNLTGHPAVILPNGFRDDGTPVSLTFLGGLFEEAKLLAVANAYQQATKFHLARPTIPLTPRPLAPPPPPPPPPAARHRHRPLYQSVPSCRPPRVFESPKAESRSMSVG